MAKFAKASWEGFTLLFCLAASASATSYEDRHSFSNFLSPVEPRPLVPPASTYIPEIGLGTWLSAAEDATCAVKWGLDAGYRHIDAAAIYGSHSPSASSAELVLTSIIGNEKYVGHGIATSGLPRSSMWITSKLWNDAHRPADVKPALEKTLSDLGVDYLDLYLMHWPVAFDLTKKGSVVDHSITILDTWFAMEQLVRAGRTKNIGISNFVQHQVETILKHCRICPAVHEFETHPYLQQSDFVKWHRKQGIRVIAYSPFANLNPIYDSQVPTVLEDPFFKSLAAVKNVTIPQLVLTWGMQRETVVIPKSVHKERIIENLGASGVRLNETDENDCSTGQEGEIE